MSNLTPQPGAAQTGALDRVWELASYALDAVADGRASYTLLRNIMREIADAAAEGLADVTAYDILPFPTRTTMNHDQDLPNGPPTNGDVVPEHGDLVDAASGCPTCGERHVDLLVWLDDSTVRCAVCGATYEP